MTKNYREAIELQAAKRAADKAAAQALLEKRLKAREEMVRQAMRPLTDVFESHENIQPLRPTDAETVVYCRKDRPLGFRVGIRCVVNQNLIELWFTRDSNVICVFRCGFRVERAPMDQSDKLIPKAIELAAEILTE